MDTHIPFTHTDTVTTEDGTLSLLTVVVAPVAVLFIFIVVVILILITIIFLHQRNKYRSKLLQCFVVLLCTKAYWKESCNE